MTAHGSGQPATPSGLATDWLVSDSLAPDTDTPPLNELYAHAARGILALPFCGRCGLPLELEQQVCDGCLAAQPAWREVEPVGVVHTATTVQRSEPGLIVAEHPYPVLDVELSSGHRLIMTTLAETTTAPPIGTGVRIGFRNVAGCAVPAATIIESNTAPSDSEVTP
jgi:uncharacterized OB-fold protein